MKWIIGLVCLFGGAALIAAIVWYSPSTPVDPDVADLSYGNVIQLPSQLGASWSEVDNPGQDGWDTEAFQAEVKKQLKRIGKELSHPTQITADHLSGLVTEDFRCADLLPKNFPVVFQNSDLVVQRWKAADVAFSEERLPLAGMGGLVTALKGLAAPFQGGSDESAPIESQFKIYRVTPTSDGVTETRQFVSLIGHNAQGRIEQHSDWIARWALQTDGEHQLVSLWPVSIEQSRGKRQGGLFSDVTQSVLQGSGAEENQFLLGLDHWFERIQDQRYSAFIGISGVTIGDVNNDGLDDMYVCQETGLPNRLFLQQEDGTLKDVSEAWEVNWLQTSRSSLFVDLDNDGDQDLVVAIMGGVVLAENDGSKYHIKKVLPSSDDTTSISAADYDNDGWLDLYVCANFSNTSLGNELPSDSADFVIHDANDGGSNSLFHNEIKDGKWNFQDVTHDVGLDANNQKYSWAATWEDYDNDGDPDLYVANDFGRDNLYRNDVVDGKVHFTDVAEEANVENAASGMSTSFGDFNRDGLMDIFVSNMYSSAGNRIAFQEQFKPDASSEVRNRMARLARGNTLLKNQGDGSFEDVSGASGVEMGRWAWGSLFFDLNNDGWEDLMVANGFVTTDDTGDL